LTPSGSGMNAIAFAKYLENLSKVSVSFVGGHTLKPPCSPQLYTIVWVRVTAVNPVL
jgi:hypothetical protein